MPINFNPAISFKADTTTVSDKTEQAVENVQQEQKADEFVKVEPKDEKKAETLTPYQYAKTYISEKAKSNPMGYAIAKGIAQGAIIGGGFLGISWICNVLPKISKKGPKFTDVLKHPLKHMDKSNKIMAGVAGLIMLGYNVLVEHLKEKSGLSENTQS